MCVVSMVMDHYYDKWKTLAPYPWNPFGPTSPVTVPMPVVVPTAPAISPEEIAEFRKLLERAREYDKRNNEPDCEMETKKKAVKELADQLGVTIDFV